MRLAAGGSENYQLQDEATGMIIYAFKGEVITCEKGHAYARFRRDIPCNAKAYTFDLQSADGTPVESEPFKPCACGADALRVGISGLGAFISGQWRFL